jgi:hypothetical protein
LALAAKAAAGEASMSHHENELQRQLDTANERIARLESSRADIVAVNTLSARNALQTVSDWWHGGKGAGARTRHMRVNY